MQYSGQSCEGALPSPHTEVTGDPHTAPPVPVTLAPANSICTQTGRGKLGDTTLGAPAWGGGGVDSVPAGPPAKDWQMWTHGLSSLPRGVGTVTPHILCFNMLLHIEVTEI